jgi:hypothetical protein
MAFSDLVARLDDACLKSFGAQVTYTPQFGVGFTLTGILDVGARQEDASPGTYALLFAKAAAFAQPPERGDEVTVGAAIYKVVDIEADAGGGLRLVLHFNRTT